VGGHAAHAAARQHAGGQVYDRHSPAPQRGGAVSSPAPSADVLDLCNSPEDAASAGPAGSAAAGAASGAGRLTGGKRKPQPELDAPGSPARAVAHGRAGGGAASGGGGDGGDDDSEVRVTLTVACPLCGRLVSGDELAINHHIDVCLQRRKIKRRIGGAGGAGGLGGGGGGYGGGGGGP
jgi:hypothetical protein